MLTCTEDWQCLFDILPIGTKFFKKGSVALLISWLNEKRSRLGECENGTDPGSLNMDSNSDRNPLSSDTRRNEHATMETLLLCG